MARLLAYNTQGDVVQFEADAIPANGNPLVVDTGGATGKAGTSSAGAVTLNKSAGLITTESVTTAAGSDYTLTITNNKVLASDLVFVNVTNGSNTGGSPTVGAVTPAAGSLVIKIHNSGAAAFNGTLKIGYTRFGM